MASGVGESGVQPTAIEFANGNRARAVFDAPRRKAEKLLAALGLTDARPVLLVIGGAESLDPATEGQLERLLERGAIRAAAEVGAIVVDGGTASGVMRVVGRAAAASDDTVELVGVAPAAKVTWPGDDRGLPDAGTELEPNHSHFVLADGAEWGGETSLLFDVVDILARGQPAAAILCGGGPIALDEVQVAARRGIPTIVIEGTGGVADQLAARPRLEARQPGGDALAQVAALADLTFVQLAGDAGELGAATTRLLRVDETLAEAWRQQKLVSIAAARQQRSFRQMQSTLLVLSVLLTFLVVTKAVLERDGFLATYPALATTFYLVILALPIVVASIAAAASRMRPGGRWVLLRGTSEALKREIFRYRARAGIYSHAETRVTTREVKLAEAIGSAMGALMRTDVNMLALRSDARPSPEPRPEADTATTASSPPAVPDSQFAPLTPLGYARRRIDPQINWYLRKATENERSARWLRWLTIVFGGVGTFLAAIGLDIWVAVSSALVGVFVTTLEAWQLETSVTLYNQAATDLTAIRTWWFALPSRQQDQQRTIDRLVERSERIIRAEHVGWVQEMQDAMTQLRLEQAADDASEGAGRDASHRRASRGDDVDDSPNGQRGEAVADV